MTADILLQVKNLKTCFYTDEGVVPAVDGVDLTVRQGETLGIVGESGCGKSVMSLSIMRLVPNPPGKVVQGEVLFRGEDLLQKPEREMRNIRGKSISMIFQEPMTSLNPLFTIGDQIAESIELHEKVGRDDALKAAVKMLTLVGIPSPEQRIHEYPHQLSGGMRQRVMIAMALACDPALLIADEPTTALDVTIQAQVLSIMQDLKARLNMAILLITHDLGVVAEMAENVLVMYAGQAVEYASVQEIFKQPLHPYTAGLLRSIPRLDQDQDTLHTIEGAVPNLLHLPRGCRFQPRCPVALEICGWEQPAMYMTAGRLVRCFKYSQTREGRD